jgi:hypothetical protein
MNRSQRARVLRWATIWLTIGAFANSYRHGIAWVQAHSPVGDEPFWAWAIAALPEVMVVIAVLLAMERLSDPRVWVIGGSGVAWTLWANGAAASPGLSGSVVALSPAWAALLALWSMDHRGDEPVQVSRPEPAQVSQTEPVSLAQKRLTQAPVSQAHEPLFAAHTEPVSRISEPVSRPKVNRSKRLTGGSSSTSQAAGLTWAMSRLTDGEPWPTVALIRTEFPEMSLATAKRVRAQDPDRTAGTADEPDGEH